MDFIEPLPEWKENSMPDHIFKIMKIELHLQTWIVTWKTFFISALFEQLSWSITALKNGGLQIPEPYYDNMQYKLYYFINGVNE